MKPTMLIGMFGVLTALITGCEALLPPMVFSTGDSNAIPGCEILFALVGESSPLGPGASGVIELYERPNATFPLPDELDSYGYTYVFYPVEYTSIAGKYWVKVWVNLVWEHINHLGEPQVDELNLGYKWIKLPIDFSPDQLLGCASLSLTDGIPGIDCNLSIPANTTVPARVGPGYDRAIFLNLTSITSTDSYFADGHQIVGENIWYRISYEGRHLWIDGEAVNQPSCDLPLVAAPLVIARLEPVNEVSFWDFPVYHCRHLGRNVFEWVSARVTYDADGIPISEEITGGHFQGEWRDGCPAGDIAVQSDPVGEPPPIPTPPPGN